MYEEIERFLSGVSLKNSEKKVRQMVADRFGGKTTNNHRYVAIEGVEYRITKNPDTNCGWEVRIMTWDHGNDWRFFSPY